ncbi:MAG: GNAT family N-acetyltransferase [Chloroflexi bacterium]|nr:GNAT family N-acetyltransferase [Chloroflexota bacterium]
MELANQLSREGFSNQLRVATRGDVGALTRLLQTAVYCHLHVDWYLPVDWIGSPGFVVYPKLALTRLNHAAKFIGQREEVLGCLVAASDVMPAAWMRVAALADMPQPRMALLAMANRVELYLRQRKVEQLAWLIMNSWPQTWLEEMGFFLVNEIETYVKKDTAMPLITSSPNLQIRPVHADDFDALARLEAAAYEPLWQHSAHALHLARPQSFSFDVALLHNEIAGFQLSSRTDAGVHLARLTVNPIYQGYGVGSALLVHALSSYHQHGLHTVSLNTQIDNLPSQALYKKFGFQASGARLPVWLKEL